MAALDAGQESVAKKRLMGASPKAPGAGQVDAARRAADGGRGGADAASRAAVNMRAGEYTISDWS